jgi:type I restriction enzyme R subunit
MSCWRSSIRSGQLRWPFDRCDVGDEVHRSQYDFIDGFALHMRDALPNALFIGFTGTPIEKTDANTRAVFGVYISVYVIQQSSTGAHSLPAA